MATTLEIHPSIGIARVGNSQHHFVGPEPATSPPTQYRDAAGGLLRQAARFRVFECDRDEAGVLIGSREVGSDAGTIEWTVHLANTKAAGPKFLPADGDAGRELRNASRPRKDVTIDPGPRTVDHPNPFASFDTGAFQQRPVPLGEIHTDGTGQLLVLGGFGVAGSVPEGRTIKNFADNDNWFDDVSDGPVRAVVTTAEGSTRAAKPSWVIVAPPDFAPPITNFVTLYDVARDVAVRRGWLTVPERPSFTRDIYPILSRPFGYAWVSARAALAHRSGQWSPSSAMWAALANPAGSVTMRRRLVDRLRDPAARPPSTVDNMPRLHDQSGQDGQVLPPTATQYALLERWMAGSFVNDWQNGQAPIETAAEALDRFALQACSGGAFFPGIEAGRVMTRTDVYSEPYRLDADALSPGQITQGNALPWQADFLLCRDDSEDPQHGESELAWWPAQRPDKVFVDIASAQTGKNPQPWARGIPRELDEGARQLVEHWAELGVVAERAGTDGRPVYVETERLLKSVEE